MKNEISVLVVVVLYQVEAGKCVTLNTFCQALKAFETANPFKLFIYDNSPAPSGLSINIPIPYVYIHDEFNSGLAQAYNAALQIAETENFEWLLLLDQDTVITNEYLQRLCMDLKDYVGDADCAAFVPRLTSKHKMLSPSRVLSWGRLPAVDSSFTGIAPFEITAYNSGTVLRVSAMRMIGGFNPVFWLDFLDHWIFNRLQFYGYKIYVLNATLMHDLSLNNMSNVSISRYENVLAAEGQFYLLYKSKIENIAYCFRLIIRALKRLAQGNEHKLFMPTLKHLFYQVHQIWRQ